MKPQLIILLAAVTLTVAMVPKLRRAVNLEEELRQSMEDSSNGTASTPATKNCKPDMPCAWYIYINSQKIIETNFINPYCNCTAGTECQYAEDDENISAYVHRCQPPNHDDNTNS